MRCEARRQLLITGRWCVYDTEELLDTLTLLLSRKKIGR